MPFINSGSTGIDAGSLATRMKVEVPTGVVDGVNTSFSTAFNIYPGTYIALLWDGVEQNGYTGYDASPVGFSITGANTFTVTHPPYLGANFRVRYFADV